MARSESGLSLLESRTGDGGGERGGTYNHEGNYWKLNTASEKWKGKQERKGMPMW